MEKNEFDVLLKECSKISDFYDGVVFIGGMAIFMHCVNAKDGFTSGVAEFTHDGDFYISLPSMSDLRDNEDVVPNRRLSKHQIIKKGFEFDIYTEHNSSLIVPYSDVAASAVRMGGFVVASLPHLLALKLEAFADRKNSSKGDKDAKDVLRIALCAKEEGFDSEEYVKYSSDEHDELLKVVLKGAYAISMASGNHHQAKKARDAVSELIEKINAVKNRHAPKSRI